MKTLSFSCIVLLMLLCTTLQAQTLERIRDGYSLGNQEYKTYDEIHDLLNTVPLAQEEFIKGQRNKEQASQYGMTSLLSLGVGALMLPAVAGDPPNILVFAGAIGAGLIGCITGTIGISKWEASWKRLNKRVPYYFNGEDLGLQEELPSYDIQLTSTGNGVGVVLSF